MPRLRTLDRLLADPVEGRVVLVRVDFNAPRNGDSILDDTRLRASLPTIAELREAGARVVLLSHAGRPGGERDPSFTLAPMARRLAKLASTEVRFVDDCIGPRAAAAVAELADGEVALLENLRFHAGEKANDPEFVDALATLGELYVDDAFGSAHRAHASIVGLAERSQMAVAGRLIEREVAAFTRLLESPPKPFVAVLGGAKISGKIKVIESLLGRVDTLLIGGGMANTFLAAQGHRLGRSLVAEDEFDVARGLLERAARDGVDLLLPDVLVWTDDLEDLGRQVRTIPVDALDDDRLMAVDIAPASLDRFAERLAGAGSVFWNGPVGVFETPPFDAGCQRLAEAIAESSAFSVVGGGETVAAVHRAGAAERIDHVSTGGGASLELIGGARLPGLAVLEDKPVVLEDKPEDEA